MTKRRQNIDQRCPRCLINMMLCFCDKIPKIQSKTKVSLLVHIKEKVLSSNTAHLAHQCLENSEFFFRGQKDYPLDLHFKFHNNYTPLYLYPSEQAIELNRDFVHSLKKPIQLIVPDGSWRQAKKFHKREPFLKDIQHVKLPAISPSVYLLRKQKYKNTVCTIEAIAYALGIIEDDILQKKLIDILKIKNDRVIKSRALSKPD